MPCVIEQCKHVLKVEDDFQIGLSILGLGFLIHTMGVGAAEVLPYFTGIAFLLQGFRPFPQILGPIM